MKKAIDTSNILDQLCKAIDQYHTVGYTVMSGVLTQQQIQLAITELNYQAQGRGVDLFDRSTWGNISGLITGGRGGQNGCTVVEFR